MAVEFDVKGSRTSEYRFLPEMLVVDPKMNGRYELHGIERQCSEQQHVPGQRRIHERRNASQINKDKLTEKPLELRCSYTALTEKQAFLANIEENRVRNATTPMDDAYNLQRLVNVYQMTLDECADSYRASVSWVKGRLALIEATPEVEKQIRAGKIKGPAAKAVAKLSKEHQQNLAKVAEEKGKVTTADIRRETGEPAKPATPPAASQGQETGNLKSLGLEMARSILDFDMQDEQIRLATLFFEACHVKYFPAKE